MSIRHLLTAAVCTLAATQALGGNATVQSSTDGNTVKMDIRWKGDNTRMDFPNQANTYMLVRDGKTYSVTNHGGRTMVMDMSAVGRMAQGMNQAGGDHGIGSGRARSVGAIEATGESETVAGVEGEVYTLRWTDQGGREHTDEAVLSDHPLALELTRAFSNFVKASSGDPDPIGQKLEKKNLGILRFGSQFRVTAIDDGTPPASTFELPAEPMDMQKMMESMGGAMQNR